MAEAAVLGLLASYKSGLTALKGSGQEGRFIRYYLRPYTEHFPKIYYFSYYHERLEDFTNDPIVLDKVQLLPKRWNVPAWLYAVLMPLAYPREFSACCVFRVFQANGVFPLWKTKAPSLVTFGYRYAEFARIERKPAWKLLLYRGMEQIALRTATVLLVTTQELFNYVQPKRGLRPVILIPNGVDPDLFKPLESPHRANGHAKTVLFVGRFERQKNLETLIQAASRLPKELRVKLRWVGQGSLENHLRQLAESSHVQLEIQPPVPHEVLPQILRQADAFALVSWTEGHPKILLEAMSIGLPCVVSDSDGSRTLIENGRSGFLCDPSNADQIATQLARVLGETDLARQLGIEARRRIVENYSLQVFINREIRMLQELATDPGNAKIASPGGWINRWLDYSCRRRLLDKDLAAMSGELRGNVLELGGGKAIRRGRFIRPLRQVSSWKTLNRESGAMPDLLADAQQIPLPNNSIDTIVCLETLEYIESPERALQEMARVLIQAGVLVLSVPYHHPKEHAGDRWRFTPGELKEKIEHGGFTIQKFYSQGGRCATVAHALKCRASREQSRIPRQLFGLLFFLPVQGLMIIDRFMHLASPNTATGFLVFARRRSNHV